MDNSEMNKSNINRNHHHHHHYHEDGADKFRKKMKNETRHWQMVKQVTFTTLCILVALTFAFLAWSYLFE